MWDNRRDCAAQLGQTIVRMEGIPVMVRDVGGDDDDLVAYIRPILDYENNPTREVSVSDLDLSPVPLGYANTGGTANYLARIPRRRWKHGLDSAAIESTTPRGRNTFRFREGGLDYLAKTITNEYPTLAAARAAVDGGVASSVAFCRLFAVAPKTVYYKGVKCGTWDAKANDVVLSNHMSYLRELWESEANAKSN